jgi:hypothetical protein
MAKFTQVNLKRNADRYAVDLVKANPFRALVIAKNCMENTAPTVAIPDKFCLNRNELNKLHGFWTQVYHIIRKRTS